MGNPTENGQQQYNMGDQLPPLRAGDNDAWQTLSDYLHHRHLYSLRGKGMPYEDAEDVLQETLIRVWTALDRISENQNPQGYLQTTVQATAIDFYRRHERHGGNTTDSLEASKSTPVDRNLVGQPIPPVEEQVIFTVDTLQALTSGAVPPEQMQAVGLHATGYVHREIADMTEAALGTVKTRIRLGREALHKNLNQPQPPQAA